MIRFNRGTAVILALLALTTGAFAQTSVLNGSMTDGYVTTVGDTIPNGWGTSALKLNDKVILYFDQTIYNSAPASARLTSDTSANTSFTTGLTNVEAAAGAMLTISAYVRHENVTLAQLACVRACGGGGYCQLPSGWKQIYRGTGTAEWYDVSLDVPAVTSTECASDATCAGRNTPLMVIHFNITGPGTFWLDDVTVTGGGTSVKLGSFVISGEAISIERNRVSFNASANYSIRILAADGQVVREFEGTGRTASLNTTGLAQGTYVVDVTSDLGYARRSIALAR